MREYKDPKTPRVDYENRCIYNYPFKGELVTIHLPKDIKDYTRTENRRGIKIKTEINEATTTLDRLALSGLKT